MIVFDNVTKSFWDDTVAIDQVSFEVEPGEMVMVTGPSGSGKTTLMKLLTKEYDPTSGSISFNGQDVSKIPKKKLHELRRQVGVVFQDYKLLNDLNVWENIALPLRIINQKDDQVAARVSDLLTLVGMEKKASLFPSQLSGGEAQRVSIARSLASAPLVIFADEPTGNLDPETSHAIADLFAQINSLGTTVIMATHDVNVMDKLKHARHLELKAGKLVKDSKKKKKDKE